MTEAEWKPRWLSPGSMLLLHIGSEGAYLLNSVTVWPSSYNLNSDLEELRGGVKRRQTLKGKHPQPWSWTMSSVTRTATSTLPEEWPWSQNPDRRGKAAQRAVSCLWARWLYPSDFAGPYHNPTGLDATPCASLSWELPEECLGLREHGQELPKECEWRHNPDSADLGSCHQNRCSAHCPPRQSLGPAPTRSLAEYQRQEIVGNSHAGDKQANRSPFSFLLNKLPWIPLSRNEVSPSHLLPVFMGGDGAVGKFPVMRLESAPVQDTVTKKLGKTKGQSPFLREPQNQRPGAQTIVRRSETVLQGGKGPR